MNRLLACLACGLLGLSGLADAQQAAGGQAATGKNAVSEAAHVHYAWANVTRVDPVYRNIQVANPPAPCVRSGPRRDTAAKTTAKTTASVAAKPAAACVQGPKTHEERRIVGYNVEYRYRGNVYLSRMSFDPGERLRVRISVTPAD